jgi:HPt (histidine-containing phosphotransfer) domain-containing protein
MGNLELADRLLARFKQGLAESAARFEDAVDAEDLAQLEKLAHRLRGEASNVSALWIADLATELEELARLQITDEALTAAEDLIVACRRFPLEVFTLSELAASPGC